MSNLKKFIKNISPMILVKYYENNYQIVSDFKDDFFSTWSNLQYIKKNQKFQNVYRNQRCFILCTGPSINKQNLLKLKDEYVFGVSTGYLHRDYLKIKPKFHCQPQITYSEMYTYEYAINHFKKLQEMTNENTEIFLNISEKKLIETEALLKNRNVNYVYFGNHFCENKKDIYEIDKIVPAVQSVSIMCIMIAMYMGFKDIYLLGTEHDFFITKEYTHAYNDINTDLREKYWVKEKKTLEVCNIVSKLFSEYRILNKIALNNNVNIHNATIGGTLDELSRVNFDEIFR